MYIFYKLYFFKIILTTCYSIAILFLTPFYCAFIVKKVSDSPAETKGYLTFSDWGKTKMFKVYSLTILFFETVIPLTALIVFNALSRRKFSQIMKEKKRLINSGESRAEKSNKRFTKLIIQLTFISIFVRTICTVNCVMHRFTMFFGLKLSADMNDLLYFSKHVGLALMFSAHSFDGILYYIYDKQMRNLSSTAKEKLLSSIG